MKFSLETGRVEACINSLSEKKAEGLRLFQAEGSFLVRSELAKQAPKRTGQLIASIIAENTEDGFEVYPTVPYAKQVEYGTGLFGKTPHLIYLKKASLLRWEESGKTIFARHTRGQPGRFFTAKTREAVIEPLASLARDIWRRIINASGP